MKHLLKGSLALVGALFAFATASHAQTVVFNGIGSSALFLELGEATSTSTSGLSPLPECIWTSKKSNDIFATDTTVNLTENGQAWIAWTPGTLAGKSSCALTATYSSATKIYAYLQTDSVVGDRCLFNSCYVTNTIPTTQATAELVWQKENTGTTVIADEEVEYLPAAIAKAFTASQPINVSGTDIRPEDAEFATTRALAPCGEAITQYTGGEGSATQYLGLGYTNGSSINSYYSTGTFHVVKFTLPSTFYVTPVGADPIVVAVNSTDAANTGFNSSRITNLNRSVLALYLDGSIGETQDALLPGGTGTYTSKTTNVLVREPLSGTYNTMEFNVPNTVSLQTSQDVGLNQPAATKNCSGSVPKWNAEGTAMETLVSGAVRTRAIGTGEELAELFVNNDALGYGFWSVSNFAAAPSTSKYLQIDGVDPLFTTYSAGAIPTTSTTLAKVNFAHVIDGTYPVWSLVRLVTKTSAEEAIANQISLAAAKYSDPVGAAHPDFVPYYTTTGALNLSIERAHFTPPGIYAEGAAPAPQDADGAKYTEAGGDVGGVILPILVDTDYVADTGSTYTGNVSGGHGVPTSYHRD